MMVFDILWLIMIFYSAFFHFCPSDILNAHVMDIFVSRSKLVCSEVIDQKTDTHWTDCSLWTTTVVSNK